MPLLCRLGITGARLQQGSLLLDFLVEPLYIHSITVAAPASASAGIRVLTANDPAATVAAPGPAALVASLRRALDTRILPLGSRLQPPFELRPPVVAVVLALPRESCFRPTTSRSVPSGVDDPLSVLVGRSPHVKTHDNLEAVMRHLSRMLSASFPPRTCSVCSISRCKGLLP